MTHFTDAVRTYVEMTAASDLRPSPFPDSSARVVHRDGISTEHFRRIYRAVGWQWQWRDRLFWPEEKLAGHLASPHVAVWECVVADDTAGFFELQAHDDASVEIAYFGLAGAFIGRGLGKALLTRAVHEAWALGPPRVWLHTCTVDAPQALPNYLARGFRVFRTEDFKHRTPDDLLPDESGFAPP